MTPKGAYFANIAAIIAAMAVSFVVSAVLLKTSKVKEEDDIEAATRRMHDMKAESKGASPLAAGNVTNDLSHVRKIIVACDAGMEFQRYGRRGTAQESAGCRAEQHLGHQQRNQ